MMDLRDHDMEREFLAQLKEMSFTRYREMSLHDELREKIRLGMKLTGLTQVELARRTGIPQGNISRILAGQRPHTHLDTWDKLLRAVGER